MRTSNVANGVLSDLLSLPLICLKILAAVAFLFCFAAGDLRAAQDLLLKLKTIDNKEVTGSVIAIELDSLTLSVGEKESKFPFDQLESIQTGVAAIAPTDKVIAVKLIDGSSFKAKSFSIKAKRLTGELHCGIQMEVDTRHVDSIRLTTYENKLELAKQWREILEDTSREGDALVVNRSNELNAIDGIAGETKESKLGFSIGDRTANVAFEKIDAVLFYHAKGRELAEPLCNIVLADESVISTRRLAWEESKLVATSVAGAEIELPLGSVVKLDFGLGRSELLSNIEPSTNDWKALLTSSAIMEKLRRLKIARINKAYSGEPLSLKFVPESGIAQFSEIRQFENGFAIQGGGKLAFSLNGRFNTLKGWVGFDPKASGSGHVKLSILADGKPLIERVLINRTMTQPLLLDLDIKDVRRIVFQVDYQDGRSTGDQLHLADLKVSQ